MADRDGTGPRKRSPRPSKRMGGRRLGPCKTTKKTGQRKRK